MNVDEAVKLCQVTTSQILKKNTHRNYSLILNKFSAVYGQIPVNLISQNEVLNFLAELNKGSVQNTKIHRFRILNSFFNFIIGSSDFEFDNPCQAPLVKKKFNGEQLKQWSILDKDIVDEIIFRTLNKKNRIIFSTIKLDLKIRPFLLVMLQQELWSKKLGIWLI